jgi:hypothetical protein
MSSRRQKKKEIPNEDDNEVIVKPKRGRKPKNTYTINDNTVASSLSDDENIIVKLDISSQDNEAPFPYNSNKYCSIDNFTDKLIDEEDKEENVEDRKVIKLLEDFKEKNKNNEWPMSTSICCYWCCHDFKNPPVGIPIKYNSIKDEFELFGCFCSLECAAAYNFKTHNNVDEMWERNNLLNFLNKKINKNSNIIKCAPDKLTLKMFGGHFTIEEFRKYTTGDKIININFPIMTSLSLQIEELNDYEVMDNKYIPLDSARVGNKSKEKIIFKRNKPLIDVKNSIETFMTENIKDEIIEEDIISDEE